MSNTLIRLLEAFPDKPWDWDYISRNPNITMKDILEHHEFPWDWDYISRNPNITLKDILEHPDKPWNWQWISCNKFEKHPTLIKRKKKKLMYMVIWAFQQLGLPMNIEIYDVIKSRL